MPMQISRRGCLRILLGAALGATLAPETSAGRSLETFYWRKVSGPYCSGGYLYETWCYFDCYGTICEELYCEQRQVGTC